MHSIIMEILIILATKLEMHTLTQKSAYISQGLIDFRSLYALGKLKLRLIHAKLHSFQINSYLVDVHLRFFAHSSIMW